jgi:hypothetical protein
MMYMYSQLSTLTYNLFDIFFLPFINKKKLNPSLNNVNVEYVLKNKNEALVFFHSEKVHV